MSRRRTLSDAGVAGLRPRAARYAVPDPELRGHYVRITPVGGKTFVTVTRGPDGKQVWTNVGPADVLPIDKAREKAREVLSRVRAGLTPVETPQTKPDTLGAVAANYMKRHVAGNGLRSRNEIQRCLDKYVLPALAERDFVSIRRSDIAKLLDHLQDTHGARQADAVLTILRSLGNWFAGRHDDYVPPFARGMGRCDPKASKRARILDDDEMRAVWAATEENDRFGAIIRLALLTAQRREKLATMRWSDVSLDGAWTVPAEHREKGTGGALVLPPLAFELIKRQPRLGDNPFVFAGRGNGPFSGFSKAKRGLDEKLPPMPPWVLHDLRRTARSLMARAGVRPDIAERVMGHAIAGVEGIYDRHGYREEKGDALRRLAGLVESIVTPTAENVVQLREAAR
jgi:integrase